jgi:outer membrane immunogenic protein
MKKLIAALSLVAISTVAASAADLPVYTKAPPLPVVAYSWTGCYLGVNGGGLWARKRWTNNDPLTGPLFGTDITDHTASGGIVGGQVGCDYQAGRWVFGIQGDGDWTNAKGSGIDNNNAFLNDESNVRGVGTITVRGGYTVTNQFLLYARGGVAFERDRYNIYRIPGGPLLTTQAAPLITSGLIATGDQDRTGAVVGVGGEYLLSKNWSVFAEYLYMDFGTQTTTPLVVTNQRPYVTMDVRERKDVVRVGVNYRFNLGGPVVANY